MPPPPPKHPLFLDENLPSFFRRLAWSPDGGWQWREPERRGMSRKRERKWGVTPLGHSCATPVATWDTAP